MYICVFFSSRRRHTRYWRDWSSDVCSSDLGKYGCNFDWDCMESRDSFLRYGRFKCVNSSIPRSRNILLFPCVVLNFFPQTFASFSLTYLSPVLVRFFIEIFFFVLASCVFFSFVFSFRFSIL